MANFTARFIVGAVTKDWVDPVAALPSRLNNVTGIGAKYFSAANATPVQVACTPQGLAEGAADSLLGGNLFAAWFAEWPSASAPVIIQTPGVSSMISFTPVAVGHYLLVISRPAGGGQCLRLMVE